MPPFVLITPTIGNAVDGTYYITFQDTEEVWPGSQLKDYDAFNPIANRSYAEYPARQADEGGPVTGNGIVNLMVANPGTFTRQLDSTGNETNFFAFQPANLQNLRTLVEWFGAGPAGGLNFYGKVPLTLDEAENILNTAMTIIGSLLGVAYVPSSSSS